MNKQVGTALSVLIGGALIASACSSGGDESTEVAAEQTSTLVSVEAEAADASVNTAAAGSATETETATEVVAATATDAQLPGETVVIEATVDFRDATGTWDVVEGPMCLAAMVERSQSFPPRIRLPKSSPVQGTEKVPSSEGSLSQDRVRRSPPTGR